MKQFKLTFLVVALMMILSNVGWGQNQIVLDDFGSTAQNPISRTGWTANAASGSAWEIRTTTPSSGYSWTNPTVSSSGTGNVFTNLGTNTNTKQLTYSNSISTVGYTGIKVRFGGIKVGTVPNINVLYSTDGATYTSAGTVTLTTSWAAYSVSLPVGAEGVSNLRIRFEVVANNSTSNNLRIDDFHIIGTPPTPTILLDHSGITQTTDGNVLQGSTNQILSNFRVNVTTSNASLNTISFTAGGNYTSTSDVAYKLYTSSTSSFPGGTALSTVTGVASGGTVTFSSLSQACNIGDRYFWITADIAGLATTSKTIIVPATPTLTFASGTPTNSITVGGTKTIVVGSVITIADNGTQPIAGTFTQGTNKNILQTFTITEGNTGPTQLTNLTAYLGGNFLASDISSLGIKLYANTSNDLATASAISSKTSSSLGAGEIISFSGLTYNISQNTSYYFWITVDVSASANGTRNINGIALTNTDFTFTIGSKSGSVTAGGLQTLGVVPAINISSAHPVAGNIDINSTDNIIGGFQLDVTIAATSLTGITVTTSGTYLTSDILANGFKFWLNSANNLTGATQLGTSQAVVSSGNNILVSGLNTALSSGTTRYILVTSSIAPGATGGNTIGISATAFSNITFSSGNKTGTDPVSISNYQTIKTPGVTISSTNPSVPLGNITQSTTNNVLYKLQLDVSNTSAYLTGLTATTAGNYVSSDVTNFKLYYSTNSTFAVGTSTLLSTISNPGTAGLKTFSSFTNQIMPVGTVYLFITTDVPCGSVLGNNISIDAIGISNLTITGITPSGSSSNGGLQTIISSTPVDATNLAATNGNTNSIVTWTSPTGCYDDIMVVASTSAFTSAVPIGNSYTYNLDFTSPLSSTFDGGKVVYKGNTSSQTVTGLTNGTQYYFRIYTRNGSNWSSGITSGANSTATPNLPSSSVVTWSNTSNTTAWLTTSNWSTNNYPSTTDVAQFANSGTAVTAGINMGTLSGAYSILGIEVTSARTRDISISNSSATSGTMTLTGGNINGLSNVILRNASNSSMSIQTSSKVLNLALGNATDNVVSVDGTGNIAISSIISGTSKNLTIKGSGSGSLVLSAINTYTGLTTVSGSTLQLNTSGGTTIPATNSIVINGGNLKVSTNQTIADLNMSSGSLIVDAGVTLTVTGTFNVTGGTINNLGTIKLNGGAVSFPGSGVTVNNGTANTLTNLEIASSGNVTLTSNIVISGALTLTSGTLSLGTNTLTLNGTTTSTTGTLTGSSSSNLVIGGTGSLGTLKLTSGSEVLNNLTMNRSTSDVATFGSILNVSGTLDLSSGKIDMGNYTLTLGTDVSSLGTLTPAIPTSSSYIIGNFERWIPQSTTSNIYFPVGSSGQFRQATIQYTSAPSTGGKLKISGHETDPGSYNTNPTLTESGTGYVIDRFAKDAWWQFTATDLAGGIYDLSLEADLIAGVNNFSKLRMLKRTDAANSEWTLLGTHIDATGSNSLPVIKRSGLTGFSQFGIGGNSTDGNSLSNAPLPVNLSTFSSSTNGKNNIKLNWLTESETNNSGFEIERKSTDGSFTKIGYVSGHGTVNTPTNYSFEDRNLQTGKYKYRLKQIDNNGNYEYFALNSEVEIGVPKKFDLSQNYPNPFNPVTKINFDLPENGKVDLRLYDMLGREVATLVNEVRTAGYYTVNFDASNLSSGIYFYRMSAGKFSSIKKMAVIK